MFHEILKLRSKRKCTAETNIAKWQRFPQRALGDHTLTNRRLDKGLTAPPLQLIHFSPLRHCFNEELSKVLRAGHRPWKSKNKQTISLRQLHTTDFTAPFNRRRVYSKFLPVKLRRTEPTGFWHAEPKSLMKLRKVGSRKIGVKRSVT